MRKVALLPVLVKA